MKQHVKNLSSLLQGTSRKVAWAVVPSVVVMLMALALSGCVKQKNCDGGRTGTFVYLKEPYKRNGIEIVGHFLTTGWLITGDVPKAFQTGDTISVNVCVKLDRRSKREGFLHLMDASPDIYSLKCIERE
jgi:hypothetical protein